MKPIRVHDAVYQIGPLACPKCERPATRPLASFGILRIRCETPGCRCRWTAIWLPPGSTSQLLLDLFSGSAVRAIVNELRPGEPIARADLGSVHLPADDGLTFVQRTASGIEPPLDWQQAQAILACVLKRVA